MDKMPSMKDEIKKFTSVNDFDLWCLKMQTLLVQRDLLEALKEYEKIDVTLTEKEKTTIIFLNNAVKIRSIQITLTLPHTGIPNPISITSNKNNRIL